MNLEYFEVLDDGRKSIGVFEMQIGCFVYFIHWVRCVHVVPSLEKILTQIEEYSEKTQYKFPQSAMLKVD